MNTTIRNLILTAAVLGIAVGAQAELKPASIFGHNMVLQREQAVPVWGTASPGEKVKVVFGDRTEETVTDAQGHWRVLLKALSASAVPQVLTISSPGNAAVPTAPPVSIVFSNVVVGEVWICSGQSNMEMALRSATNAPQEIAAANWPGIRMFTVAKKTSVTPLDHCNGDWAVCTPSNAPPFSAVGYFFALNLYRELQIPIGMINSAWGGTPAEAWTSLPGLQTLPQFKKQVDDYSQTVQDYLANTEKYEQRQQAAVKSFTTRRMAWYESLDADDRGNQEHWAAPTFIMPTNWKTISTPVALGVNPQGWYIGSLWHRKTVAIPAAWVGKELELHLGAVDEADDTYVNGQHVGRIWFEVPNYWQVRRVYPVPAALVTTTNVIIVVRVLNLFGDVGLMGPASEMRLVLKGATDQPPVSLAGDWVYAPGLAIVPATIPKPAPDSTPGSSPSQPAALYNGMIAPLIPYAIRGAIWYQGEANASNPLGYRELLPGLIASWRQAWGQPIPFGIVQLANFMAVQHAPVETNSWADLREAQTLTLRVPETGLALAIDIGDASNIHPRNKQDVGKRLALWAEAKVYGKQNLEFSGPVYRSMTIKENEARLQFDHANGLAPKGDRLTGFAIAGADKVFHKAQARIADGTVIVWSEQVAQPAAVRYAWANNPICNLYNSAGLPAVPFRTDDWPQKEIAAAQERVP